MAAEKHSRLSPSSFPLLVACPASYNAQLPYENISGPSAQEGTWAHEHAAMLLKSRYVNRGQTAFFLEGEMEKHVRVYVDHVQSIVGDGIPNIEEKIQIKSIHPDCFGTPDCWFYNNDTNELHVWDFKYGFNPVEVKENWQLMAYASGVIESTFFKCFTPKIKKNMKIHLYIIQPRARHKDGAIRTWTLDRPYYQQMFQRLKNSISISQKPDAPFVAGEHCRYCRARLNCEEFKKTSKILSVVHESKELTPGLIGAELEELNRAAKIIDYRITTLREEAERVLKSGGFIAGFKLKGSFSRDKWTCTGWDIAAAFKDSGVELPDLDKIITPRQALKAGIDKEFVSANTKREFLGDRVVADKDVIEAEIDWEGAE